MSPQMDNSFQKYKGARRIKCWCSEGGFKTLCSIHWTRFLCIAHDCCHSVRCNFATARLRRRCQRCCFSKHSGKMEDAPKVWGTTISKPKIMGQHHRSCGTTGKKLPRTSISKIITGTKIRKNSVGRREWWEIIPEWQGLRMHRKVAYFYQFTWMKWRAKSKLTWSTCGKTDDQDRSWRTNSNYRPSKKT